MGYNTQYTLTWDAPPDSTIHHKHKFPKGAAYCPTCGEALEVDSTVKRIIDAELTYTKNYILSGWGEGIKWYEHEDDMKKLSKRIAGVVFKLRGIGEEHPDEWVKYFKDGKMQMYKMPEWVPPPVDENEWK
jgi:hypothetical protein